jgi:hypothetical protein
MNIFNDYTILHNMDLKKGERVKSDESIKLWRALLFESSIDFTLTSFSFLEALYLFEFLASGIQKNRSCLSKN